MNRGKMKKVLALMLTFIFVISATACGGATKFDAEAYVRGVMDANYKQKYDEYAKAQPTDLVVMNGRIISRNMTSMRKPAVFQKRMQRQRLRIH